MEQIVTISFIIKIKHLRTKYLMPDFNLGKLRSKLNLITDAAIETNQTKQQLLD